MGAIFFGFTFLVFCGLGFKFFWEGVREEGGGMGSFCPEQVWPKAVLAKTGLAKSGFGLKPFGLMRS